MKKILYVHDQQDNPAQTRQFLELAGYRVDLVSNGDECVDRVAREQPALVLMDVLIEGRNGFEVCRQIRKLHTPEQLPVILSSAIYRSRIYREEAMQAGAQLYVLKPFKLDDLVGSVHELLDLHACLLSAHSAAHEGQNDVRRPTPGAPPAGR